MYEVFQFYLGLQHSSVPVYLCPLIPPAPVHVDISGTSISTSYGVAVHVPLLVPQLVPQGKHGITCKSPAHDVAEPG